MDGVLDGCGEGCLDGCADGCTDDLKGCWPFGRSGGSSSSTGYQAGRVTGAVADAVIDVIGPDERERSKPAEKGHRCRRSGKHERVTLWLTVRKEHADEVVDMLLHYGRNELRVSKITSWMSLWASFGWRRCAVVAHCYHGEEAELCKKLASLKREFPGRIKS